MKYSKKRKKQQKIHLRPISGNDSFHYYTCINRSAPLQRKYWAANQKRIQKRFVHCNLCLFDVVCGVRVRWYFCLVAVACSLLIFNTLLLLLFLSWAEIWNFETNLKSKKGTEYKKLEKNLRIKYFGITVNWCGWTKCAFISFSQTLSLSLFFSPFEIYFSTLN